MNNDLNLFVSFTKKDDSQHIVEGYASTEDLDSQGEVVRFEAIKKALPDYMKFGNIREMHQNSAVGKAVKAIPDEERRGLYLSAKIVDSDAWMKVQEGVYNGFSIGGRVLKQVGNEIHDLVLSEISVVDRPANPAALFSLVKFEGKGGENMDLKDKNSAEEVAKADGGPDHMEIYRASDLLYIAADLCMLYEIYEMNGVDASNLDKAIQLLKEVAVKELDGSNAAQSQEAKAQRETAQKLYDVLTAFQKKNITAQAIKTLALSEFAYIDKAGKKFLPLQDAEAVTKAIASFDTVSFENDDAKKRAAKKIIATAKRHNVEVDTASSVTITAKAADLEEVKYLFRSDSWTSGYFDQMKKVLG